MNTLLLKERALTGNPAGIGTVIRKRLRERAVELAVIDDRSPQDASKSDGDRAKQELTGEPDVDPKEPVDQSAPESERADPVPGSAEQEAPVVSSEVVFQGQNDGKMVVELASTRASL